MDEKELKEIEDALEENCEKVYEACDTYEQRDNLEFVARKLLEEVKRLKSVEVMWNNSERILRQKLDGEYAEIQHRAYHALFDNDKTATCVVCNPPIPKKRGRAHHDLSCDYIGCCNGDKCGYYD